MTKTIFSNGEGEMLSFKNQGGEREEGEDSSIRTSPLPLCALRPPPLADSSLEMGCRGCDVLACVFHCGADFITV